MADITMCMGNNCNKKKKCYRYTAIPDQWQSWSSYDEIKKAGHCEYFWNNKGMKNREKSK